MRTYTPQLGPDVLARLSDYADSFAPDFTWPRPARWAGVYLQGLLPVRRRLLPRAGAAFRRRATPVLRGLGQEGQLPGRRLRPLRQSQGPLPPGPAPLPARQLAVRRGPSGPRRRSPGGASCPDQ